MIKIPPLTISPREHEFGSPDIAVRLNAESQNSPRVDLDRRIGSVATNFLVFEVDQMSENDSFFQAFGATALQRSRAQINLMRENSPEEYQQTLQQAEIQPADELSKAELKKFYEVRKARVLTVEAENGEKLDSWKEEFVSSMDWASKHGLRVDMERIRKRMKQVRIGIFDISLVSAEGEDVESQALADYKMDSDEVRLGAELFDEGTDETAAKEKLFHELLHSVGGMRLVRYRSDQKTGRTSQGFSYLRRDATIHEAISSKKHLTWLDEAIVEQFAQVLVHRNEIHIPKGRKGRKFFQDLSPEEFYELGKLAQDKIYPKEREVLFKYALPLIAKEKHPVAMAIEASLEDYEPGGRAGRQPRRKELLHTLRTYIDLPAWDRRYRKHGDYVLFHRAKGDYSLEKEARQNEFLSEGDFTQAKRNQRHEARKRTKANIKQIKKQLRRAG